MQRLHISSSKRRALIRKFVRHELGHGHVSGTFDDFMEEFGLYGKPGIYDWIKGEILRHYWARGMSPAMVAAFFGRRWPWYVRLYDALTGAD